MDLLLLIQRRLSWKEFQSRRNEKGRERERERERERLAHHTDVAAAIGVWGLCCCCVLLLSQQQQPGTYRSTMENCQAIRETEREREREAKRRWNLRKSLRQLHFARSTDKHVGLPAVCTSVNFVLLRPEIFTVAAAPLLCSFRCCFCCYSVAVCWSVLLWLLLLLLPLCPSVRSDHRLLLRKPPSAASTIALVQSQSVARENSTCPGGWLIYSRVVVVVVDVILEKRETTGKIFFFVPTDFFSYPQRSCCWTCSRCTSLTSRMRTWRSGSRWAERARGSDLVALHALKSR